MKKQIVIVLLAIVAITSPVYAVEDPFAQGAQAAIDTFSDGCQKELTTFCKDVTPGEGRVLACLYAFQDKVSPRCERAVYDSLGQLDRALTNLSYAVSECREDLETYCGEIKPGEGRLLDCLNSNESKISDRCNSALKDVGYKK